MNITVTEDGEGGYLISFDGTEIKLGTRDMKELLVQAAGVLAPSSSMVKKVEAHQHDFMTRLRGAGDVGVQAFIQTADHDDIVVLLKFSENDEELRRKLFHNMSDTNRKIFLEDLEYKFQDNVADSLVRAALERLERVVEELEADGRPVY
jgi:flagellar motor switch protein FliG